MSIVDAFSHETCELIKSGWTHDRVDSVVREFLRQLIVAARYYYEGDAERKLPAMLSSLATVLPEFDRVLCATREWKRYEKGLLELERIQERAPSAALTSEGSVGTKLRRYREESGLTQEQLAERIKVTARTVKRHEAGQTKIRGTNERAYEKELSICLVGPCGYKSVTTSVSMSPSVPKCP